MRFGVVGKRCKVKREFRNSCEILQYFLADTIMSWKKTCLERRPLITPDAFYFRLSPVKENT